MRVGIVNDAALAVDAVRRAVLSSGEHKLAWIAYDGAQAVRLCARDTPDLILMDLRMPRMDGVEATHQIMERTPCPILVVTANVNESASKVFAAMGAGALDAVNTPIGECPGADKGTKVLLAKMDKIRRQVGAESRQRSQARSGEIAGSPGQDVAGLVVIGASAGGPAALATVLGQLPGDFPAGVVIVQHVDPQFAQGLVTWLDHQTDLEVRVAKEGDRPLPGVALLAGKDQHLILTGSRRLAYTVHPSETTYRPSIDVLFRSVERNWQGEVVGVLLTGMGRDGAEGLQLLREAGFHTIAQDQGSSAVYGMPRAAARLRAASQILALDKIGPRLASIMQHKCKARA